MVGRNTKLERRKRKERKGAGDESNRREEREKENGSEEIEGNAREESEETGDERGECFIKINWRN